MSLALVPLPAHGGELMPVLQNPSLDKMRWTVMIDLAVWHWGCLFDKPNTQNFREILLKHGVPDTWHFLPTLVRHFGGERADSSED